MRAAATAAEPVRSFLPGWVWIGPVLFLIAGTAFGVLEAHSSTDTWIGLAAGRQIMEQTNFLDLRNTFPIKDTFSYTFYGTTWYNQNWLSHLYFWLLYDNLGPNWVIYGTWAATAAIFLLVMGAVRIRTGSWLTGIVAGAMVGVGTRDWVSARPATIQFTLLATLWLLLSSLLDLPERGRVWPWSPVQRGLFDPMTGRVVAGRWWPIFALLPLFLIWGNAHGSFIFGYLMVGALLGCWALCRAVELAIEKSRFASITDQQAIGAGLLVGMSVVLLIALGPYGWDNFTHQSKVAKSEAFRSVSEWVSPFLTAAFPPVGRFKAALAVLACIPLVVLALWAFDPFRPPERRDRPRPAREPSNYRWQAILFDIASVGLSLYMAIWARRFAPMFYIMATPALAKWTLLGAAAISPRLRSIARDGVVLLCWPLAGVTAGFTIHLAYKELVTYFQDKTQYILLDRITRADYTAREAMEFLRRNDITCNVFTDWTQAGSVMFFVPKARVFMDGRAQQVFDEAHYNLYGQFLNAPVDRWKWMNAELARFGTDTILARRSGAHANLFNVLATTDDWVLVYFGPEATVYMRPGSEALAQLAQRMRDGSAWWPDSLDSKVIQGMVWSRINPPDPEMALKTWKSALDANITLGTDLYKRIAGYLAGHKKYDEAEAFLREQADKLNAATELEPALRTQLAGELQRAAVQLRERRAAAAKEAPR